MNFQQWLAQADDADKREASEFRHHYPVEVGVLSLGEIHEGFIHLDLDDFDEADWQHAVACGCNEAFGFEYGSEGHRPA